MSHTDGHMYNDVLLLRDLCFRMFIAYGTSTEHQVVRTCTKIWNSYSLSFRSYGGFPVSALWPLPLT